MRWQLVSFQLVRTSLRALWILHEILLLSYAPHTYIHIICWLQCGVYNMLRVQFKLHNMCLAGSEPERLLILDWTTPTGEGAPAHPDALLYICLPTHAQETITRGCSWPPRQNSKAPTAQKPTRRRIKSRCSLNRGWKQGAHFARISHQKAAPAHKQEQERKLAIYWHGKGGIHILQLDEEWRCWRWKLDFLCAPEWNGDSLQRLFSFFAEREREIGPLLLESDHARREIQIFSTAIRAFNFKYDKRQ